MPNREYDIFEKLPDGTLLWRAVIRGLENTLTELKKFGEQSQNELLAIHTPTKQTIARVNVQNPE